MTMVLLSTKRVGLLQRGQIPKRRMLNAYKTSFPITEND